MQVTTSYDDPTVVPTHIHDRYVWLETGYAASILQATSRGEFSDLLTVLDGFQLQANTWLVAGGNRGDIAAMLDDRFRQLGWKETRIDAEARALPQAG